MFEVRVADNFHYGDENRSLHADAGKLLSVSVARKHCGAIFCHSAPVLF